MTDQKLIQAARAMLTRSYAPFSHYAVGAALLGSDGQVYTGCNIESAAFGATLCAERSAIANAFSHGCHSFVRGAVIADSDDYCTPCGICRQVMQEFAPNLTVICLNGKGEAKTFALKELLPYGFDNRWLPEEK